MKLLPILFGLALGGVIFGDEAVTDAVRVELRSSSPREAVRSMLDAALAGQNRAALESAEALTDGPLADLLLEDERALVGLARGLLGPLVEPELLELVEPFPALAEDAAGRLDESREALVSARSAAAGPVRLRAVYGLGTLELFEAERALRRWVFEQSEGSQAQAPTAVPGGPAAGSGAPDDAEPEDPMEVVRRLIEGFVEARTLLVERVRIDAKAEDPRANLEWAQRRIRELERIERELEEQQEQEQQQQDQQQDQDEQQEPEDSDPSQDQQEPDPQESDSQEGEEEESDSEEGEESPEEGDEEGDEQESGEEDRTAEPDSTEEQVAPELSQEEIVELLDRLAAEEARAEALREHRRLSGRRAVEKDW
ncbi:MAG: hypothetical protein ACYSWX_06220 [Planctomycetota bacterium]|jgi:hypothetical protein